MSKKSQTSTALAVVGSDVPTLLERVNAEIAKLKHIQDSVYKTTMKDPQFGNLKEEKLIPNLLRVFSTILGKQHYYEAAAEELGLSSYPVFHYEGSEVADWKHDILLRIAIIEQKDTLDKLNQFKERASKLLSEEDQKNLLARDMAKFLGAE